MGDDAFADCRNSELCCSNNYHLAAPIVGRVARIYVPEPTREKHEVSLKVTYDMVDEQVQEKRGDPERFKDVIRTRQLFHCMVGGLVQSGGLVVDEKCVAPVWQRFIYMSERTMGKAPSSFGPRPLDRIRRFARVVATDRAWVMLCSLNPSQPYTDRMWDDPLWLSALLSITEEDVLVAISFFAHEVYDNAQETVVDVLLDVLVD